MQAWLSGLLSSFFLVSTAQALPSWSTLGKGLDYYKHHEERATMHLFRVDLATLTLSPIVHTPTSYVKVMSKKNKALLAINANFFDPQKKPLGLVIHNYQVVNPLREVSWWGIFFIENNRAAISSLKEFKPISAIITAVQSGPRLIADGEIVPGLKPQSAPKSFVCIQDATHVVIGASASTLSMHTLAALLKNELGCSSALNLDGGSSTQLYAKVGKFELDLSSPVSIPVALGVFEKK